MLIISGQVDHKKNRR